jgi:hypothetical protein
MSTGKKHAGAVTTRAVLNAMSTEARLKNAQFPGKTIPRPDTVGTKTVTPMLHPDIDERHLKPKGSGKIRKYEQENLPSLNFTIDKSGMQTPEKKSIVDLEGKPYISTMSDQSNVGTVTHIRGQELNEPIRLHGGQDYMFDPANKGQVWASEKGPTNWIMNMANEMKAKTGEDPLFIPWRMAPTGSHFNTMLPELMMKYMRQNLSAEELAAITKDIKGTTKKNKAGDVLVNLNKFVGFEPDQIVPQLQNMTGDERKLLINALDKYRDKGGLSLPEARLIISDPKQLNAADTSLQNVGVVHAGKTPPTSAHPTYGYGVPGEGMFELAEDIKTLELLDPQKSVRDPKEALKYKQVDAEGNPILGGFWNPSDPGDKKGVIKALMGNTGLATDVIDPRRARLNRQQFAGGIITEKDLRHLEDAGVFKYHGVTPDEQKAITQTLKGQRGSATLEELAAIAGLSASTIAALPLIYSQLKKDGSDK